MRDRTYKINQDKLKSLSEVYRPSRIAAKLNISKQLWHNYKTGSHDVPEAIVDKLCAEYGLSKNDLVLMP